MLVNDHLTNGTVSWAGQCKSGSMTLHEKNGENKEGVILKKEENVIEVQLSCKGYKADESTREEKDDYFTEDQEQASSVLLDKYILLW